MQKITICSKNPVKIQAVKEAFESHFTEIEYKTLDLSHYDARYETWLNLPEAV